MPRDPRADLALCWRLLLQLLRPHIMFYRLPVLEAQRLRQPHVGSAMLCLHGSWGKSCTVMLLLPLLLVMIETEPACTR